MSASASVKAAPKGLSEDQTAPLTEQDFAALMAPLAPFEAAPVLAVAVSGGADSLALCLLTDIWARARGGRVVALTVDHGLRPEAAAEARTLGLWLKGRGVSHHILRHRGPRPVTGVQAAAREARYRLLREWCAARGVLHLLVAHHQDDQAETFLLRKARHSGPLGLAAMGPVTFLPEVRLLRPFLGLSREVLKATLCAWEQPWIEDPSNSDESFARVRLRRRLPDLAAAGLTPALLARRAAEFGTLRRLQEGLALSLAAAAVTLYPAGYGVIDRRALAAAPSAVSRLVLARLLRTLGAGGYGPRGERLDLLHRALCAGPLVRGRTLGGCRVLSLARQDWAAHGFAGKRRAEGDILLVCREAARSPRLPWGAGKGPALMGWDGRFVLGFRRPGKVPLSSGLSLTVAALGQEGWRQLVAAFPAARVVCLPAPVRAALPALWQRERLLAAPHFAASLPKGKKKGERGQGSPGAIPSMSAVFVPATPFFPAIFAKL